MQPSQANAQIVQTHLHTWLTECGLALESLGDHQVLSLDGLAHLCAHVKDDTEADQIAQFKARTDALEGEL